jgi:hypothetical protein
MAVLDCTLLTFKVPGLYDYTPPFGTKNPDGEGITTTEVNTNVMMPFLRQRPMAVTENSSTTQIESNVLFQLQTAGTTLTVGEANFNGCVISLVNTSSGKVSIVLDGKTFFMAPGDLFTFKYVNGNWLPRDIFEIPMGEIAFAIGQSGLANYEAKKTITQRIQSGEVTIYNRGVISGCVVTGTHLGPRTVSMAVGTIFKDGMAIPMQPFNDTVAIPQNPGSATTCFVYLNDNRQLAVTPLGEDTPANGIPLYRANVGANSTQADLTGVTFTDVRRIEAAFPLISLTRPFATVVLPYNFVDTRYTVILETVSMKGPWETKGVIDVEGKAINGFNIYNETYSDHVVVRWTAINEKI